MEIDVIIPVVPKDVHKLQMTIPELYNCLEIDNIYVIGNYGVKEELEKYNLLSDRTCFFEENNIIEFDEVRKEIQSITDNENAIKRTGWYYQQFLKMQWCKQCNNSYYIVWDADTIPLRKITMFEKGKPTFDVKYEYNQTYFDTIERLGINLKKMEQKSFISEHMIFDVNIMNELISDIEDANNDLYWKSILRVIDKNSIDNNGFSEFETYGNYCMLKYKDEYLIREYDSFRDGGRYFDINQVKNSYDWIKKDYTSISFEKWAVPKPLYIKVFSIKIIHYLFNFRKFYEFTLECEKISTKIKSKIKRK